MEKNDVFIFGREENDGVPVSLRKDDLMAMLPPAIVAKVSDRWTDEEYLAIYFKDGHLPKAFTDGRIEACLTLCGMGKDENYGKWWYRELKDASISDDEYKGEMVISIGKRLYAIMIGKTKAII